MSKLTIYMKSGNSFTVSVEEWEMTKGTGFKRLEWTNAAKGNALIYVDMGEVEAIVEVK